MNQIHPPITVSVKVAGEMLGLSTPDAKALCDQGLIKAGFSGQTRLVDVASIRDYLASLPAVST
jgi:hypothetical protein